MKKRNKIAGILLAVCMAFSLLTVSAGAASVSGSSYLDSLNEKLPITSSWEDSKVVFTFTGTGEDVYAYVLTSPPNVTYNMGLSADGKLLDWQTGLEVKASGAQFHTQAGVEYQVRASLTGQSEMVPMCFLALTDHALTPAEMRFIEFREEPLESPDYIIDKTVTLPVTSTWEDSMTVAILTLSSRELGDVYVYVLGPGDGLYHVGYASYRNGEKFFAAGRDNILGWFPDLAAGQEGAVIHTHVYTSYEIRVSAAQPGEYRVIVSTAPVDLTWVDQVHPFTDVSRDAPETMEDYILTNSILYVYANGWMTGTTSTTFSPDDYFTRAMLWTVLARMNDADTAGGDPWYEPARQWAMDAGISDGTFPDRNASLQEVITMLYNQAGRPAATTRKNIDADGQVAGWARDAMTWAYSECLIQGGDPAGAVTRAELAVILAEYAIVIAR